MSKYRVFIEGTNALLSIRNAVSRQGFFTTRFVEADDSDQAVDRILELIRNELKPKILNESTNPPKLTVHEIQHLHAFGETPAPCTGFTWYPEQEDETDYIEFLIDTIKSI